MSSSDSEKSGDSELWAKYAPAYVKVVGSLSFYQDVRDRAVEHVSGLEKVLDLGCGPGLFSAELAGKCGEVVGLDSEKAMLEFAERENSRQNISYVGGDAHEINFPDNYFDGVVCNNVLYYVENPENVLSEARRVLKQGGVLVVAGPKPDVDIRLLVDTMTAELKEKGLFEQLKPEIGVIAECNKIIDESGLKNVYTNGQLEGMLKKAGFSTILESSDCYLNQNYFIAAK